MSDNERVQEGKFGRGGVPTPISPGRPKGTPNKLTTELKEMILTALSDAGGVDYLVRQATETPTAFLSLVGKVLPMTIAGDKDHPLRHKITIELVRPGEVT